MSTQIQTLDSKPRLRKFGNGWVCGVVVSRRTIEGCLGRSPEDAYTRWSFAVYDAQTK